MTFERQITDDGMAFKLASFDAAGAVIGDDRDYDLLKAAITPLENLIDLVAIANDHPGRVVLMLECADGRLTAMGD